MDIHQLQDRVNWGLNRVAAVTGHVTDLFRPRGLADPLRSENRILRLPAFFTGSTGGVDQSSHFGERFWRGHFDGAYTQAGDYLQQDRDIWFIASQMPLLPILCVKTNVTISVVRTAAPSTGVSYGAADITSATPVISRWPACLMGLAGGPRSTFALPTDTSVPIWTVLLPSTGEIVIQLSDIISDGQGSTGIVNGVERGNHGWRLSVKQITT